MAGAEEPGLTAECGGGCVCLRHLRAGLVPPVVDLDFRCANGARRVLTVRPLVLASGASGGPLLLYTFGGDFDEGQEEFPAPAAAVLVGRALSSRELMVLQYLAMGWEIQHIAVELGLSPHTVRNHSTSIRRKLDVRTSLEAVMVAVRRGIIPPPVHEYGESAQNMCLGTDFDRGSFCAGLVGDYYLHQGDMVAMPYGFGECGLLCRHWLMVVEYPVVAVGVSRSAPCPRGWTFQCLRRGSSAVFARLGHRRCWWSPSRFREWSSRRGRTRSSWQMVMVTEYPVLLSGKDLDMGWYHQQSPFLRCDMPGSPGNDDNHANQMNPNNDAYWDSRGFDGRPDDWEDQVDEDEGGGDDNRANQLNPNNDAYSSSRGSS